MSIRVTARDGLSIEVANWQTWRRFIDRIFTRPCPRCSGEGIVFWAVDVWHAEKCHRCGGIGRVQNWRLF
jgi:DnaJ-class molecular chaperone